MGDKLLEFVRVRRHGDFPTHVCGPLALVLRLGEVFASDLDKDVVGFAANPSAAESAFVYKCTDRGGVEELVPHSRERKAKTLQIRTAVVTKTVVDNLLRPELAIDALEWDTTSRLTSNLGL